MAVSLTTFTDPASTTLAVSSINDLPNTKKKTLSFLDGTVVSIQPDGSIESRPAGSDGGYERCSVDGQVATWYYQQAGEWRGPFTYAFVLVQG